MTENEHTKEVETELCSIVTGKFPKSINPEVYQEN